MKPELLILLVCGGALHFSKENEEATNEKNLEKETEKTQNNISQKKRLKKESKVSKS